MKKSNKKGCVIWIIVLGLALSISQWLIGGDIDDPEDRLNDVEAIVGLIITAILALSFGLIKSSDP